MPSIPFSIPVVQPMELRLPKEIEDLYELAHNLWWTWSPEAQRLFSAIDSWAWSNYQNPVEVLAAVDDARWRTLIEDHTFMEKVSAVVGKFESYLAGNGGTWFEDSFSAEQRLHAERAPVAYFSMEYGLHQSFALYSGGLGVLSGDHCKSASDLGIPLVGVGLLYRSGYFHQTVDPDGFQQHSYPVYDYRRLGLRKVANRTGGDLVVEVPFPGHVVSARVWTLLVGRVPVLLLDTDLALNDPADRPIASVLYVRGREMRLAQEMLLGVGGARALAALDIEPAAWHINEGHSALLVLEQLRRLTGGNGDELEAALSQCRAHNMITIHTPVPAGHETFDRQLAARYLEPWSGLIGVPTERLLALGSGDHGSSDQPFNLTALALRGSGFTNGVSGLNAEVSDRNWRHLSPEAGSDQPVIRPITNGVHVPTWIGVEFRDLLARQLGPIGNAGLNTERLAAALAATPDSELWEAHQKQKQRLARYLRSRLRRQYARHGRSPDSLRAVDTLFDPDVLTLGFARRFATYKRADLLFRDADRVRSLLAHTERPVQVILAGKAHPTDRPGQELIRHVFELSQDDELHGHIFFLEDYDMGVAKMLVQGVDAWLNTPRRPKEACGTSGMKAAINGVLNCSILDGWWPEAFDGDNGWAIDAGEHGDEEEQDRADAEALYEILETQVLPIFYERDKEGLPRRWVAMMKHSIASILPAFSSRRMVKDYVEQGYAPHWAELVGPVAVSASESTDGTA